MYGLLLTPFCGIDSFKMHLKLEPDGCYLVLAKVKFLLKVNYRPLICVLFEALESTVM
jgi:hypothetical protein